MKTEPTTNFDGLLSEVEETLRKAIPIGDEESGEKPRDAVQDMDDDADDQHIADAAGEGAESGDEEDRKRKEGESNDEGYDELPMGKSFRVTLANGDEADAVDGTQIVQALAQKLDTHEGQFAKSLTQVGNLLKSLAANSTRQEQILKSLSARVEKLSGEGRGRRTTLTIHEKPTTTATLEPAGVEPEEFMQKALALQIAGKLTGLDISRAEAYLNSGMQPPDDVVRKVAAAA